MVGCLRKTEQPAAEELREELPGNVDKDIFEKLLQQRIKILGGN